MSSLSISAARRAPRKTLLVLLAVIAVISASLLIPSRAHAAERADAYVTEASLTRSTGKTIDEPLREGESVTFAFKWDSTQYNNTDQAPQPGDTMSFTFPAWLSAPRTTVDMKDDDGNVYAVCAQEPAVDTAPSAVVCTFTSYVSDKIDLNGHMETTILLAASPTPVDPTVTLGPVTAVLKTLNGDSQPSGPVLCENCSGIWAQDRYPLPVKPSKNVITSGVRTWAGGDYVIQWGILAQGNGGALVVTDQLSAPQKLATAPVTNAYIRTRSISGEGAAGGNWEPVSSGGTATELDRSNYTLTTEDNSDGQLVTVTIPKSDPDKWYRIALDAVVAADAYQDGDIVSNTATVSGPTVATTHTVQGATKAYATGQQNTGNVYIYKTLKGGTVPAGTTLPKAFDVSYTIDGVTTIKQVTVGANPDDALALTDLPVGTVVTIKEAKKPADTGAIAWGNPVYGEGKLGTLEKQHVVVAPDNSSMSVTVLGGQTIEANITNPYTVVPVEPTPVVSSTSATPVEPTPVVSSTSATPVEPTPVVPSFPFDYSVPEASVSSSAPAEPAKADLSAKDVPWWLIPVAVVIPAAIAALGSAVAGAGGSSHDSQSSVPATPVVSTPMTSLPSQPAAPGTAAPGNGVNATYISAAGNDASDSQPAEQDEELANTGSAIMGITGLAIVLMVMGAGLLLVRNRKES